MTHDPNNAGSGATTTPGGAGGDNQTPPPSGSNPVDGKGPVAWADHERALNDMHRFKTEARAAAAKLAELSSTVEDLKKKALTESQDFKTLYETEREKRQAAETAKGELQGAVVMQERHRAAYPALKKAGLRDDAENLLDHLDLSDIEVEATTGGRFVTSGVESFVEKVAKKYPYAFAKTPPPNVNGSSGSGLPAGQKWNPDKLFVLERDCKKKGDMAPYYAAHKEWIQQGKPAS